MSSIFLVFASPYSWTRSSKRKFRAPDAEFIEGATKDRDDENDAIFRVLHRAALQHGESGTQCPDRSHSGPVGEDLCRLEYCRYSHNHYRHHPEARLNHFESLLRRLLRLACNTPGKCSRSSRQLSEEGVARRGCTWIFDAGIRTDPGC